MIGQKAISLIQEIHIQTPGRTTGGNLTILNHHSLKPSQLQENCFENNLNFKILKIKMIINCKNKSAQYFKKEI